MKVGIACACLAALALAHSVSVRGATIAYWRFEEGTTNQPATGAGSILDSSGNNCM